MGYNLKRARGERSRVTKTTGRHVHHVVPLKKGGDNRLGNLMLLHPVCHYQLHHNPLGRVAGRST